jgi:CotH kinase protein/Lamin Tail Domain
MTARNRCGAMLPRYRGGTPRDRSGLALALKCVVVAAFAAWALPLTGAGAPAPVISEFMASNDSTITDQDGDFADWLELFNPGPGAADLGGWYLTNKAASPTKWQIPEVSLPAGGYLVIFCSQKNYTDPGQPMATNFNLASGGGYVALVESDGTTVASSYTFPVQYPDISYGVSQPASSAEAPQVGYLEAASPGAANGDHTNILLTDVVTISAPPGIFTGTESFSLSGASSSEHIRYVLASGSAAGDQVAPPTAASPEYNGAMTISATTLVKAAVFSADDSQRGMTSSAMYVRLDDSTSNRLDTFSSTLPLVVFDDNGFGPLPNNHVFYPAWFGAFSPGADGSATLVQDPDFFTSDTMKLHGFSSAGFPKQSYESALTDARGRDLTEALFGLAPDKSWDNISAWNIDRTFIHNGFVYSLARSMGYWAPGTKFSEMFIHSAGGILDSTSYAGITAMTERLKVAPARINIYALTPGDVTAPNVTGGYVLRFDHAEPPTGAYTYYTWTTSQGSTLMLDTPKADLLVPAQIDYITGYVQQMEDAMASDRASGYATRNYLGYLDRPSWVDYHLLNVFVENVDAFQFSEYFTKDVNGLVRAGPVWDYDRSMGSADGRDANPQQWTATNVGDYWNDGWWAYVTHDPDFMQLWVDRWQGLRRTLLSNGSLGLLVNSQAAQIGPEAAARDAARWTNDVSRYGGAWSGEIANLTSWLTTRAQWIDQQFAAPPSVQLAGASRVLTPAPGTQVAYTLDGSDPRLSGGAVSASAQLTAAPVTLAAGQAFAARSYNASMAGAYPGSPWSSPVGGADRLTNVSGRNMAGQGPDVLVEGFVISGPANSQEQVLLRADGPALGQYGLASSLLPQPILSLYNSAGVLLASNAAWGTAENAPAIANAAAMVGAFPLGAGSADSALLLNLAPGPYTMQISGVVQSAGVALGEVYEVGSSGSGVVNLSTRGLVPAGGALINGLVVSGSAPQQVLIRGDGPALAAYGVANFLAKPVLNLFDAAGVLVASNTGWGTGPGASQIAAASSQVGAFALAPGSADSALLVTLQPGNYTVVISGGGGSAGVALAETYAVP